MARLTQLALIGAFFALAVWLGSPAPTQGCIAIPYRPQDSDIEMNLPEQRAFLYRQGTTEHLILSVQYTGATAEFAWVIPTETRARVDVQPGAPFHELWKLTRIEQPNVMMEGAGARAPGAAPSVKVLERKIAGPYDVAVLHASSGGGLYQWLRENGFGLNQKSRSALDDYVKKGWYFVAARIRPGKKGRDEIDRALRDGTIAPLHIAYRATELSYPLRVTAGNPGSSKIELFVVADQPPRQAGLESRSFRLTPLGKEGFKVAGPPGAVTESGDFPTLRKLLPRGGTLTKYTGLLAETERQRDLVFARLSDSAVR
ncbi:MAG: DUF2330 domain-containing protein [Armatimonadetes bacterium]|nr:DUF2330 domain-containing protein [Armatimonadota bacterium]